MAHMLKHSICCTFMASCVVLVVVVVRPWHQCVVVVVVRPKTPMCGFGCGESLPLHVCLWLWLWSDLNTHVWLLLWLWSDQKHPCVVVVVVVATGNLVGRCVVVVGKKGKLTTLI